MGYGTANKRFGIQCATQYEGQALKTILILVSTFWAKRTMKNKSQFTFNQCIIQQYKNKFNCTIICQQVKTNLYQTAELERNLLSNQILLSLHDDHEHQKLFTMGCVTQEIITLKREYVFTSIAQNNDRTFSRSAWSFRVSMTNRDVHENFSKLPRAVKSPINDAITNSNYPK